MFSRSLTFTNNPAKIKENIILTPLFMYIPRQVENEIQPFLARKEVIAITGPRQSGKTTLLKQLYAQICQNKKCLFLTFEKQADLELFQTNIDEFKNLYQNYEVIIIDEFQYAKQGGQKLKYLYDTTDIKYIVSGSSSLELTYQTGKYMVGRIINFKLMPFSFNEFLLSQNQDLANLLKQQIPSWQSYGPSQAFSDNINKKLKSYFEKYLIYGGYPAVVLAKSQAEKEKVLASIFDNYLLKDIKSLLQLTTEEELKRLVRFLAIQIGNLVEHQKLSNVADLSYNDLQKHLKILKETFILNFIKPFFTNKKIELVKMPKVYFIDTGLRNFALKDFRYLEFRNDVGSLVENSVDVELKSVERFDSVFEAQILSHMKLGNYKIGLLINFKSRLLKDCIKRYII